MSGSLRWSEFLMLYITLVLFVFYIFFQTVYIFVPWFLSYPKPVRFLTRQKGFSVLIPVFNEETIVASNLLQNLKVNYTNYEIIVINDGSTDNTFYKLMETFQLVKVSRIPHEKLLYKQVRGIYHSTIYPKVWVVDKENGGKADALNVGIDFSRNDWVITVDADTLLGKQSMHALNTSILDPSIVAIGGAVHISQAQEDLGNPQFLLKGLIDFQVFQYLTSFYLYKYTQSLFKGITVISGAFGAFQKSVLFEVGGYRSSVGEDMDITIKIHKWIHKRNKDKKMVFVPEAVSYTECPSSYRDIFKQRFRWQKAFIDCLAVYHKDLFRRLNLSTSGFMLFDAFFLGTLNTFPILLIPIAWLLEPGFSGLFVFLIVTSFLVGVFQNLTALLVSRRYLFRYKASHYIFASIFLIFEVFTYRLLGLIFVSVGTILYFIDRDSWYRVKRSNKLEINGGTGKNENISSRD